MTFPVPAPTAELVRAFVEVTYEALKRAETAEAERAECQKLADALGLDNRALQDRLRERDETIARQGRTQADSDTLVRRLRDPADSTALIGSVAEALEAGARSGRPPVSRPGVMLEQARRLRAFVGGRDTDATPFRDGPRPHVGPPVRCWCGMTHGAGQATALNGEVIVADSTETPYLEARDIPAAGRDRIEKNT